MNDCRHRAQIGKTTPHALAGGNMGPVKGAGFAGIKSLGQVIGVPQIKVANLRSFKRGNTENLTSRNPKTCRISRRHHGLRYSSGA
jgi:hypothetical protein